MADAPITSWPDDGPRRQALVPIGIDEATAGEIVDWAVQRYFDARRDRIAGFVDRHFSLKGSLRLHRHAVGWDVLRAPANVAFVLPTAGMKLSALGLRRCGPGAAGAARWLESRDLFLRTRVGAELQWLLHTELLELPLEQDGRHFARDALAEQILSHPLVHGAVEQTVLSVRHAAERPELRERLTEAMSTYTGTRAAAADITNALIAAGVGAAAFKQLTPGAITMGPALAAVLAQQFAILSFPLGTGLGGLWYGVFPAAASGALVAGSMVGLMGAAAVMAAFAGILADPAQRKLGLHQRRLKRMLDTLERQFGGDAEAQFIVRDHYVARLVDIVDLMRVAIRVGQ